MSNNKKYDNLPYFYLSVKNSDSIQMYPFTARVVFLFLFYLGFGLGIYIWVVKI